MKVETRATLILDFIQDYLGVMYKDEKTCGLNGFVIQLLLSPPNFSHEVIPPKIPPLSGVAAPTAWSSAVSPV